MNTLQKYGLEHNISLWNDEEFDIKIFGACDQKREIEGLNLSTREFAEIVFAWIEATNQRTDAMKDISEFTDEDWSNMSNQWNRCAKIYYTTKMCNQIGMSRELIASLQHGIMKNPLGYLAQVFVGPTIKDIELVELAYLVGYPEEISVTALRADAAAPYESLTKMPELMFEDASST